MEGGCKLEIDLAETLVAKLENPHQFYGGKLLPCQITQQFKRFTRITPKQVR